MATMKMLMAVIPKQEANAVMAALVEAGHTTTFMESRGGVLRQAKQALFIALQDDDLNEVMEIIDHTCHSCVSLESAASEPGAESSAPRHTAQVGGAVVFVWPLESIQRF
jgi:uncharacterized protein YaaQ